MNLIEHTTPITFTHLTIPSSTIRYQPLDTGITVTETTHEGRRWYVYNGQYYPSITTLLSATDSEGKKALREWRDKVGADAANAITKRAAGRGIQMHSIAEHFVQNDPIPWNLLTEPGDVSYAASLGHLLNQKVEEVFASETRVISTELGVAGRVDLGVLLRDGRRAILDFKTGAREKTGNRLNNYFKQITFYATALTELLKKNVDTLVIVQLLPKEIKWQESTPEYWIDALRADIRQYATMVNDEMERGELSLPTATN